ncbi:MAG: tRNA (adenosine(37)-N6)-threonylcarbamoyltransferase complex ATPase subunit type 1 TsaE [Proteobacteria bacterium]|nr:tRNA (adenosine(37)-N6)-threonylcarbamoyltransferase complex ATPase subunit type 1 TsaE [Pseudomonadota bacterium]
MTVELPDAAATAALAERMCGLLPDDTSGWILLLEGELGSGKSTFARAMIVMMGHSGPVPSPSYTLVEPYRLAGRTIYHVDLYRVTSEDELRYLGWNELDDGLRIVEWPDRVPALRNQADIRIGLRYAGSGREADIDGLSARGRRLVSKLDASSTSLQD